MRKLLLVTTASLCAAILSVQPGMAQRGGGKGGGKGGDKGAPAAPAEPPPAGLECFDNLPIPDYPRAALQGKITGSVWETMEVGQGGTLGKLDTQVVSAWADGPKLLTPPAEAAIRSAKLKADCAGKKVLVVFRYELHGDATANPQVTNRKEPPNLVWIESQPATAAGTAGKAATK
ncbi:MAG: hypothetical protein JO307_30005 [Bryobacterales bacterium]|nr:hypothetical protein [Bryobacterales bacterium]MBV9397106.1 hypothetical protein [Bryobacterales bacterium]